MFSVRRLCAITRIPVGWANTCARPSYVNHTYMCRLDRQINIGQTEKQASDRQMNGQTDRQTDRQADRQTDRQKDT